MSVEIVIWMFIYNFAECKARAGYVQTMASLMA